MYEEGRDTGALQSGLKESIEKNSGKKPKNLEIGNGAVLNDLYPFTAIVGQEDLKLALMLNAISPAVGGVLIQGEKGNAKSTAVRALAHLLPPIPVVPGCPLHCDPREPFSFCPHCQGKPWTGEPDCLPAPVASLPLGATEDRLLGHMDLEAAMTEGRRRFQPGILAMAHRGILYVDEVNLLEDYLVDMLLDVAASGWSRVEREGFSVIHPARFILVGTMNPEEGELRPQLLDRFGLSVKVRTPENLEERVEVMRRRIAFEADRRKFCESWQVQEQQVQATLLQARERLQQVVLPHGMMEEAARICIEAKTEGLRADLVICEASRALAAYRGRSEVGRDEVYKAAEMALLHRAQHPWQPEPDPGKNSSSGDWQPSWNPSDNGPSGSGSSAELRGEEGSGKKETSPFAVQELAMQYPQIPELERARIPGQESARHHALAEAQHAPAGMLKEALFPIGSLFRWQVTALAQPGEKTPGRESVSHPFAASRSKRARGRVHPLRGRVLRSRSLSSLEQLPQRRLDWPATLTHALLRRAMRTRPDHPLQPASTRPSHRLPFIPLPVTSLRLTPSVFLPLRPRLEDLQEKIYWLPYKERWLFLVDASSSMTGFRQMEQTKGALMSAVQRAYTRRASFAILSFRNAQAELVLAPTKCVAQARLSLEKLPNGGNTPLALGLVKAGKLCDLWCRKDPGLKVHLILFTDGRANARVAAGARGTGNGTRPAAERLHNARHAAGAARSDNLTKSEFEHLLAEVLEAAHDLTAKGVSSTVIDTERGGIRLGLARQIAGALKAPVIELDALARTFKEA